MEFSKDYLNKFFNIQNDGNEIFLVLKEMINFKSGYIYFSNPQTLEYSYNPLEININDIQEPYLIEDLKINNTTFGFIVITGDFSEKDRENFSICSAIISNVVKNIEISKIMNMQIEALQEGYEKVQESSEIKNKFISHISHELRTPLNSIIGFSDLLKQEFTGKLNKKQKEFVNDIQVSSINLLGMINEILDMAKIEANSLKLNIQKFPIKQVIQETLNIIQPLALKKDINIKVDSEDYTINADYQKFQQILLNLLSNAIKFTPRRGLIEIKAHKNEKEIQLSIKDNGIGIEPKNQEKIFEKFEQFTEQKESSTGLGLAIVKELVKLHCGKISVESELNKGSEFTITFPVENS